MRLTKLALAVGLALAFEGPLAAEEQAPPASASDAAQADATPAAAPAAAAEADAPVPGRELGQAGYDSQGRPGRIHVVKKGDTLWDISDAYLGTPWVWPSIWKDNTAEVENPHRIYPSERIWISPYEMRKVSDAEAAEMLARTPAEEAAPVEPMPAAIADPDGPEPMHPRAMYHYAEIDTTGFVTLEELEGAASIVDAPTLRTMLSDNTEVVIGLGEGEVAVGDQLDVFRPGELVVDPATSKKIGRVTEQLGWLEVTVVHKESATAIVRKSRSEIVRGDHVMPRRHRDPDVAIGDRTSVEGMIAWTPNHRLQMSQGDVVYLNRGSRQGLELGSPIEVYDPMGKERDTVRDEVRELPDTVIGKGIVVDLYDDTAVAVVTHATVELMRGYRFRGSDSIAP